MESQNLIGSVTRNDKGGKCPKVKKDETKKVPRYPRFHNDSLQTIIADLKYEINELRKKCETYQNMYRKLEKEYNDYKSGIITVREIDILGDDYYKNPTSEIDVEH